MSISRSLDFNTLVIESMCDAFKSAHDAVDSFFTSLAGAKTYLQHAGREVHLLGEGLLHIGAAPRDVKTDLKRDSVTCATETGLAIAEDVAAEVTIAVAGVEAIEKAINTPAEKRNLLHLGAEFFESVASSTMAAFHAGANVIHDLERSGEAWEANPHKKIADKPVMKMNQSYGLPPYIPLYI